MPACRRHQHVPVPLQGGPRAAGAERRHHGNDGHAAREVPERPPVHQARAADAGRHAHQRSHLRLPHERREPAHRPDQHPPGAPARPRKLHNALAHADSGAPPHLPRPGPSWPRPLATTCVRLGSYPASCADSLALRHIALSVTRDRFTHSIGCNCWRSCTSSLPLHAHCCHGLSLYAPSS